MLHRFTARMDNLSRILTFTVAIVLILPFVAIGRHLAHSGDLRLLIAPILIVIAMGIAALYRPTGYSLDATGLHIHRPAGTVVLALNSIQSVSPMTMADLGFGLRTFGSGGFFGYFGKFWYKKIGHATFYATDREKLILLQLDNDKKVVISPEDTQGFLTAFRELRE